MSETELMDIVDWLRRFKTILIKSDASKPEGVAVARIAEAADEIERLRRSPVAEGGGSDPIREEMARALEQARGALRLDAMMDEHGLPYGTTTVALEAIDAALSKNRAGSKASEPPPNPR